MAAPTMVHHSSCARGNGHRNHNGFDWNAKVFAFHQISSRSSQPLPKSQRSSQEASAAAAAAVDPNNIYEGSGDLGLVAEVPTPEVRCFLTFKLVLIWLQLIPKSNELFCC